MRGNAWVVDKKQSTGRIFLSWEITPALGKDKYLVPSPPSVYCYISDCIEF